MKLTNLGFLLICVFAFDSLCVAEEVSGEEPYQKKFPKLYESYSKELKVFNAFLSARKNDPDSYPPLHVIDNAYNYFGNDLVEEKMPEIGRINKVDGFQMSMYELSAEDPDFLPAIYGKGLAQMAYANYYSESVESAIEMYRAATNYFSFVLNKDPNYYPAIEQSLISTMNSGEYRSTIEIAEKYLDEGTRVAIYTIMLTNPRLRENEEAYKMVARELLELKLSPPK